MITLGVLLGPIVVLGSLVFARNAVSTWIVCGRGYVLMRCTLIASQSKLYYRIRDKSDDDIPPAVFAIMPAGLIKVVLFVLESHLGRTITSQVGGMLRVELQTPVTAVSLDPPTTIARRFLIPSLASNSSSLLPR